MSWPVFFITGAVTVVGLVAYICLGRKIWSSNGDQISSPPYQWPDNVFCLILGFYFLMLMINAPDSGHSLQLKDIQAGTLFYLLLDIIIVSFLLIRHIDPIQTFGIRKLRGLQPLKWAILWLAALYPVIFLVQTLLENIQGVTSSPQPLVQFLVENPRFSDRATVAVLAVVVAPLTEELIFRGYLYGVMRKYAGRVGAMFVSSALFAGIHQHLPAFPGLFLLAIGLSMVYEATGCILAPILMHALFNLIGVSAAILWPFTSL